MATKAIHHIRRSFSILLGAAGLLILAAVIFWGALVWRLAQGPLNLDYLTGYLENAFNNDKTDFVFDVGTTVLTWYGRFEPFEIEMHDVRVTRADGTPVLKVEKAGVRLSKRNLLMGRIIPREIKVYNPTLRVIRWEDGHVSLNLGSPPEQVYGPPTATAPTEAADDRGSVQLVRGLLEKLRAGSGMLGGLRQIDIRDAEVFYVDKDMDVRWRSRNADIRIVSERGEAIVADVGMVFSAARDNKAFLRASVRYDWKSDRTEMGLTFSDINPARIAQESETLKELSQIDMPLKGAFRASLGSDLKPEQVRFAIASDPGSFSALGLYPTPVEVKKIYILGSADMKARTMTVTQAKVDFGGVVAEAGIDLTTSEAGIKDVTIKAVLLNTPMDDLHKYWPETLAADARGWVTKNLTKGMATKATLDAEISYDRAQEKDKVSIRKVGGEIDFKGIQVDYFSPLMPATEAHGKATYDDKSFNLDIAGGKRGDMTVTKSTIHITDLHVQSATVDSKIDVAVSLKGPLKTALSVLDSPPLEYPKMLGIKSAEVAGDVSIDVGFKFPLRNDLEISQVNVIATADADNVLLKSMVAGMDLTGGPMKVSFRDSTLGVKGAAHLAGMPLTFEWEKYFSDNATLDSRVTAKGAANSAVLAAFGVPADLNIVGSVPADATFTQKRDGTAALDLKADLSPVSFSVPMVDYKKAVGNRGELSLQMSLKNDKPETIRNLRLKTDDAEVKGDVDFTIDASTGTFAAKKAVLSQVKLGATDIAVTAVNNGIAGYDLAIRGRQFDASSFFAPSTQENSDAAAAMKVTPLKADIQIDKMITGDKKSLDKPRILLERNEWQRIDRLEIDAVAGGKPFTIRYGPQGKGRSLDVKAENAGAALSILGLAHSVRDGRLSVEAVTGDKDGPRDLRGTIVLADFTLKDAPVIAKLLNSMSLPGILQLLSGQGLSFKKAKAKFAWTDRGQPEQEENVRYITIKDGQTSGASLGLTFEGSINNWKNTYDLEGTIIPASEVNKLVGIIPIVGDILTGGGEGIIAAKYTIKGPKDNPRVMVNPLSVLAPGILRKIFFD